MEIAAFLLFLHGADGHDVRVASEQITALHSPSQPRSAHYPEKAKCLINLADGKFVAVLESCPEIQRMLEQPK
jgi:hypothetical protein